MSEIYVLFHLSLTTEMTNFGPHSDHWKCTFYQHWKHMEPQLCVLLEPCFFFHVIPCVTVASRGCLGVINLGQTVGRNGIILSAVNMLLV